MRSGFGSRQAGYLRGRAAVSDGPPGSELELGSILTSWLRLIGHLLDGLGGISAALIFAKQHALLILHGRIDAMKVPHLVASWGQTVSATIHSAMPKDRVSQLRPVAVRT